MQHSQDWISAAPTNCSHTDRGSSTGREELRGADRGPKRRQKHTRGIGQIGSKIKTDRHGLHSPPALLPPPPSFSFPFAVSACLRVSWALCPPGPFPAPFPFASVPIFMLLPEVSEGVEERIRASGNRSYIQLRIFFFADQYPTNSFLLAKAIVLCRRLKS